MYNVRNMLIIHTYVLYTRRKQPIKKNRNFVFTTSHTRHIHSGKLPNMNIKSLKVGTPNKAIIIQYKRKECDT